MAQPTFAVGDVVKYGNALHVVLEVKDYNKSTKENNASYYDYGVDYVICNLDELNKFDGQVMTKSDIEEHITTVNISSDTRDVPIEHVEDVAPYEILPVEAYSVRKKTPKTVVVYV